VLAVASVVSEEKGCIVSDTAAPHNVQSKVKMFSLLTSLVAENSMDTDLPLDETVSEENW
jgi:hypothetical protein